MFSSAQQIPDNSPETPHIKQTLNFAKRNLLIRVGLAMVVLSAIYLIPAVFDAIDSALNHGYLLVRSFFEAGLNDQLDVVFQTLISLVLVSLGIILLLGSTRLKRLEAPRAWCIMSGIADILLAGGMLLRIASKLVLLNYYTMVVTLGFEDETIVRLSDAFIPPAYMLVFVSVVLYIVSAISQKKVGAVNLLLLFAGIVMAISVIIQVGLSIFDGGNNVVTLVTLHVIPAVLLCTGLVLRGLAPLCLPRSISYSVGALRGVS